MKTQNSQKRRSVKDDIFLLCDRIREASFALHQHLRHGHQKKVYENGLASCVRKMALPVAQQNPLRVFDDDGTLLGDFFSDIFVDGRLIVELKVFRTLADEPVAQLPGYLRASPIEDGRLINVGSPRLQIRKFALTPI
jgi:GxxExxY protein